MTPKKQKELYIGCAVASFLQTTDIEMNANTNQQNDGQIRCQPTILTMLNPNVACCACGKSMGLAEISGRHEGA